GSTASNGQYESQGVLRDENRFIRADTKQVYFYCLTLFRRSPAGLMTWDRPLQPMLPGYYPDEETGCTTQRPMLFRMRCIMTDSPAPEMTLEGIRSVPLSASLDDETAAQLRSRLNVRRAPRGALLFRVGDKGDAMYLIESGRVRIAVTNADQQ